MMRYISDRTERYMVPTGDPDEFIAWINEKIAATGVPREQVRIDIGTEYDDYEDSQNAYIAFEYEREETAEEQARREEEEAYRQDYRRREYERLKAEFEEK